VRHFGREVEVSIGGCPYTLSRLTRGIFRRFVDFADQTLPDPATIAQDCISRVPEPTARLIATEAYRWAVARLWFFAPHMTALLFSHVGLCHLFFLLLQKHHAVSREQATDLLSALTTDVFLQVMPTLQGIAPIDPVKLLDNACEQAGLLPQARATDSRPDPNYWLRMDVSLMQNYYLKPAQIDELTLTEITLLATDVEKLPPLVPLENLSYWQRLPVSTLLDIARRAAK
jgi:hypothetical protein